MRLNIMTQERKELIQEFEKWFATDPNPDITAAECANIAEKYADRKIKKLALSDITSRFSFKELQYMLVMLTEGQDKINSSKAYDIDLNSIDEYAEAYHQAKLKLLGISNVMCRAGDFVKAAGGDWIKVLRVEGRNIYLDYDDGLNCLDVDDVIAWKHGTYTLL